MFIELHQGRGKDPLLINTDNIVEVHTYIDSAMISLITDRKVSVNETYEEVKRLIMEGK